MKRWIILNKVKSQKSKVKSDDIIQILLKNRGLIKKKDVDEFLNPSMETLTAQKVGLDIKELDRAIDRIKKAIRDKESVVVWTDYDVDGIASGAILWETLYALGCKALPYVPHRVEEGYGLSQRGIDKVKKEFAATLIVTVDHGISAAEKIAYAKRMGMGTIIIDHHLKPSLLPKTEALIHTTALCATGIAWFFANYLINKLGAKKVKNDNLDLVALATVADLVPLLGANRTLLYHGLSKLNKTKRIGLRALISESGIAGKEIGVYEIGHLLSPRINALGRLTHALDALRLICTKDRDRAIRLAKTLNTTNYDRQIMTELAFSHAKKTVVRETDSRLIFISHRSYQPGIIGLVAGRLVEEFNRPTIVISQGTEYSKASARSVPGFNIVEFIRSASDLLVDVGGHPMACGFTVLTENIEKLKKRVMKSINQHLEEDKLEKTIKIDMELPIEIIDSNFYRLMQKLSPFGIGNPEPIFVSRNLEVVSQSRIGKEKNHLRLTVNNYNAVGFGMGEFYEKLELGKPIDIAYTVALDRWNGKNSLQLKLKDVKFAM